MKIWDFAYFLNIKTMGISPTLGFDTTTTSIIQGGKAKFAGSKTC